MLYHVSNQGQRLTQVAGKQLLSPELRLERNGRRLIVDVVVQANGYILNLHEESTEPEVDHLRRFGLTRREAEVLSFVAMGKTNAEIAIILGISRLTVGKHMEHILQRLGVETRTAAAATAIEARTSINHWAFDEGGSARQP